jgi:hypothetical protein
VWIVGVAGIVIAVVGGWYVIPRLASARAARVAALGVRREIEQIDVRIDRAQENGRVWDTRTVGLSSSIWDSESAALRAVLADEEYDFVARFYEAAQRTDRLVKAQPAIKVRDLEDSFRIIRGLHRGALDAIRWCTEWRVWRHLIHRRRLPHCLAPTPMSRRCNVCGHSARGHEQVHLFRFGRARQVERLGRCYECACQRYSDPVDPYSRITRTRVWLRYRLHLHDVRRLRHNERTFEPATTTFFREAD